MITKREINKRMKEEILMFEEKGWEWGDISKLADKYGVTPDAIHKARTRLRNASNTVNS